MKNGKYSISDVANMLGVSKATVSRAINGNPGVGDELRKRVLDLVDEIGYRPNTIAKSLIKGHVNIIALILGDIRNPFYADLTFYIQQRLNKSGYMLVVLNSEYYVERELEFLAAIGFMDGCREKVSAYRRIYPSSVLTTLHFPPSEALSLQPSARMSG